MKPYLGTLTVLVSLIAGAFAQSAPPGTAPQIRSDRQTFSIDGKDLILIGGSMHYFRIPPDEWDASLERMHEDGFNIVDTYIPWFVHEPEENKFDFTRLERFLDAAKKHGLYVVARPGPYINSETDQGGFPRWLSGKGVGYRTDSELSRKWSKHWYDAVMPVLARHQLTHGGPVIMVQIENEYGHPQYLSVEEKKAYLRFLIQTASSYGFDIPFMGNDMQFAQDTGDPVLSKLYGTADVYVGSYDELEKMAARQRALNTDTPLGSAEYSLLGPDATVVTMLGMGMDYMDLYLFRGGSQFGFAAKGYQDASYECDAPVAEGGYTLPSYAALKLKAFLLRQYGATLARAEAPSQAPTVDDPEVWITQRNKDGEGFLFVRSDVRGVSERTLALKSASAQHITYRDPVSGSARTIPQYSTLLMRREQARIMPLDLPVRGESRLVYSTADLLGKYSFPDRTWMVLYGNPGEESEAVLSFPSKPADLSSDAVWNEDSKEAGFRLQFGDRDQIIPVTGEISLLVLSRERAVRAREFSLDGEPALAVSDADDALVETTGQTATLRLQLRRHVGEVTILAGAKLSQAEAGGQKRPVRQNSGVQQFDADISIPSLSLPEPAVRMTGSRKGLVPEITKTLPGLVSLPEAGIWKKGITHYRASFALQARDLQLDFFTDDDKTVYVNGQFVPEASNRAKEAILSSRYCEGASRCAVDLYSIDTGRPKEDLGLWRLDEKKGLQSAAWLDGASSLPLDTTWQVEFTSLDGAARPANRGFGPMTIEYAFPRPAQDLAAVWRAFMPPVPGLVYLNGVYVEYAQPGRIPELGHPGIYLPPSMLKEQNTLVFVTLQPPPSGLQLPLISPDADSIRKESTLVLTFAKRQ